ncbi:MAG TPA: alpha/beta hydrolase [Candidatus Binatia bacterium]
MRERAHFHAADLHGIARLATDATGAVTDIVEAMHESVTRPPSLPASSLSGRAGGLSGLIYSSVRLVARCIGGGIDLALTPIVPLLGKRASTPERDVLLSVLNGVIGDHLADSGNPLAVGMELRTGGRALELRRKALARVFPSASPRVVVFVHGLCGSDVQWKGRAVDYGVGLERDHDFTALYLRYNSGLHISTNGRRLATLLETLAREWPADNLELMLVGHSMGGLVARSAVHYAGLASHSWTTSLSRIAFLGTPHHGAPLERGGHWFHEVLGSIRYASPLSRLARLRSAGITDLRHGNLLDEDWHAADRFSRAHDTRIPLSLPKGIDCLAAAATTGGSLGDARDRLVGDGLVPVASALGTHADPQRDLGIAPSRSFIVYRAHHLELLGHSEVYEHLSRWLTS